MRKNDQVKVETAAEIYSKIKVKTMIAITALFFSSMILAFVSIFIKGENFYGVYFTFIGSIPLRRNAFIFSWVWDISFQVFRRRYSSAPYS